MRRALVAALVFVVAACSSSGRVDGPVLTSTGAKRFFDHDAIVIGEVVYDEAEDCLLLERDGRRYPVIWPAGSRWRRDPPAVIARGGIVIEPGMTVQGSGRYLTTGVVRRDIGADVADAALRCMGFGRQIAVFNRGTRVEIVAGG